MTRTVGQRVNCPACGREHTVQSGFHRWIMNNDRLDSRKDGICVTDNDAVILKYKDAFDKCGWAAGQRKVNHLMHVEIKSRGADTTFAQADTLRILDSVMMRTPLRRQRQNETKPARRPTVKCINARGQLVDVFVWGVYVLRFSGNCPQSSEWMTWRSKVCQSCDDRNISEWHLECLMRFEINPLTLEKMSTRRHHKYVAGGWRS